ncbi:unnamed protein product [Ixodes pacificus]
MPFATRLRSYLLFYLEARGIQTKDDLIDLLVADQLKARMSPEALSYVTLKEDPSWHKAPELSRLMRLYEQAEGRGAASKNVDAEGSGALGNKRRGSREYDKIHAKSGRQTGYGPAERMLRVRLLGPPKS